MTTKILSIALAVACALIIGLSIEIVHLKYYPVQTAPSYCQSYEALAKFKEDHPSMIITCDNEPE